MIGRQTTTIGIWSGRILSALVVIILLVDAAVHLFAPQLLSAEMSASGFPVELAPVLAVLMLLCAAVYAYSRTSVLGLSATTSPGERLRFAGQVSSLVTAFSEGPIARSGR